MSLKLDDPPYHKILARRQERAELVGRQPAKGCTAGQSLHDMAPVEHRNAGNGGVGQCFDLALLQLGP